ncbi:hypothetical protein M407DRAFT_79996, partial [Tulasnella calospora MUT 4182]
DPTVRGAYWNGLALDHYFKDTADSWASMRTSWTDINATQARCIPVWQCILCNQVSALKSISCSWITYLPISLARLPKARH